MPENNIKLRGSGVIKLVIKRKKKFASALLTYWVVTGIPKQELLNQFKLEEDKYRFNEESGQYFQNEGKRVKTYIRSLKKYGTEIANGQTVTVELDDKVQTVFACTYDGRFTDEISLTDYWTHDNCYEICLTTKGGWARPSYPYFKPRKRFKK